MPSVPLNLEIYEAGRDDIPALYALYDQIGQKDEGYFEACFDKRCLILIVSLPSSVSPAMSDANINNEDPLVPSHDPSSSSRGLTTGSKTQDDKIPRSSRGMTAEGEGYINVGFGVLNFEPKYRLYQKLGIPEIQDLNVIPAARQQGIATALLNQFEQIARDKGYAEIGISVGLTSNYGPAQRLYIKKGYIPDGQGVTHDRQAVEHGYSYPLDDDLALMMVKTL